MAFLGVTMILVVSPFLFIIASSAIVIFLILYISYSIYHKKLKPSWYLYWQPYIDDWIHRSKAPKKSSAETLRLFAATNAIIPPMMSDPAVVGFSPSLSTPSPTLQNSVSAVVNMFKPGGRIVRAEKDSKSNKKNWWHLVNSIDANVYLSEEELQELEQRIKEIRQARRYGKQMLGFDTVSEKKDHVLDSAYNSENLKNKGNDTFASDSPEEVGSAPEYPEVVETKVKVEEEIKDMATKRLLI